MRRRTFVSGLVAAGIGSPLFGALRTQRLEDAAAVLETATRSRQVAAAVLHVRQRDETFTRAFGAAASERASFLLGSISKPIAVTALMTLLDRGEFRLEDPACKFLPDFTGDGREQITIRQLVTHVSGLPDQLPENETLRKKHASLAEFAEHAVRTPLSFAPGQRFQYSSMAILLAARIAERISGQEIRSWIEQSVFRPLGMHDSAQGLGKFKLEDVVPSQTERAAPEAGGGDPAAKDWDWNSEYWRKLGAPWGGTHCSAPDVARFLAELLDQRGQVVRPDTARRMTTNHNSAGLTPWGLGVNVGQGAGSPGCSESTFGHTGSTGTIAWADSATRTICVVLTSLPARAVQPHPRDLAAAQVAQAAG